MDLLSRLRLMPPGSLVPAEWVLGELEREQGGEVAAHEPASGADLTVDQVAERLHRSPSTVRNWYAAGLLPGAYKLRGKEIRIPAATLQAFLQREAEGEKPTAPRQRGQGKQDLGDWRQHVRKAG